MFCRTIAAGAIAVPLLAALACPEAVAAKATAPSSESIVANRGVVELETGSSAGISVRIVEDIASIVNDGATCSLPRLRRRTGRGTRVAGLCRGIGLSPNPPSARTVARIEPEARLRASLTRYGEIRDRLILRQGQPRVSLALNPGYS